MARSDEQLAYYVAQAREIIDLSLLSQKQIVDDLQQLAGAGASAAGLSRLMEDIDASLEHSGAGLGRLRRPDVRPARRLRADPGRRAGRAAGAGQPPRSRGQKRQIEEQRRMALEKALAGPAGLRPRHAQQRRIGISGSVLFALNSDQLQPEGRQLLKSLAAPLNAYLAIARRTADGQRLHRRPPVRDSNRRSPTTGNSRPSAR
jgi:outer membrane protein OmpA-like peptidoglycan-associated protein